MGVGLVKRHKPDFGRLIHIIVSLGESISLGGLVSETEDHTKTKYGSSGLRYSYKTQKQKRRDLNQEIYENQREVKRYNELA